MLKILLILFSLFLVGCATQTKYIKCNYAPIPQKPIKSDYKNYQEYLKSIFIYTYELESFKEYCIK